MDPDDFDLGRPAASALHGRKKGWGLWPVVTGAGLAFCVVWARPSGLRRMPFRLQVPFVPSSTKQVENMMSLLEGRSGKLVDLGSGDGRIANLSDCRNVTMFLAPGLAPLLERKLLAELPEDACVVVARFPFLRWTPTGVTGDGLEKVWAYNIRAVRQAQQGVAGESPAEEAKHDAG